MCKVGAGGKMRGLCLERYVEYIYMCVFVRELSKVEGGSCVDSGQRVHER